MCLLVNVAETAKHVSELDAQRFTIPIFKCLVDFCGIFYVVTMSFLCFKKTSSAKFGLGLFLERFGSAKAYKIFVRMAVNDASTCTICRGMVANGAKPCIICW